MKKKEIIQAVVLSTVVNGEKYAKVDILELASTSVEDPAENASVMDPAEKASMMSAQFCAENLLHDTDACSEHIGVDFFVVLHRALITYSLHYIGKAEKDVREMSSAESRRASEATLAKFVTNHLIMVSTLEYITAELGIEFTKLQDPIYYRSLYERERLKREDLERQLGTIRPFLRDLISNLEAIAEPASEIQTAFASLRQEEALATASQPKP